MGVGRVMGYKNYKSSLFILFAAIISCNLFLFALKAWDLLIFVKNIFEFVHLKILLMCIYRFKRPYLHLQAIEGMMIVDGQFKLTYNTIKLVRLPIIIIIFSLQLWRIYRCQ